MKTHTKEACLLDCDVTVEVEVDYEPITRATRFDPPSGGVFIKHVWLNGQQKKVVDPRNNGTFHYSTPNIDIKELISQNQLDSWSLEILEDLEEGREYF